MNKTTSLILVALSLVACGGEPFGGTEPDAAGGAGGSPGSPGRPRRTQPVDNLRLRRNIGGYGSWRYAKYPESGKLVNGMALVKKVWYIHSVDQTKDHYD